MLMMVEKGEKVMWLMACPEYVVMNSNFRKEWPDCDGVADALRFDAETAAMWLLAIMRDWNWKRDD